MEGHLAVRDGGSPGTILDAANFAQVREEALAKGLVTRAEVDVSLERLAARDFAVFSPVMFTAWGRRPTLTVNSSEPDLPPSLRSDREHSPRDISHGHS